jgi:hypothetical protein
MIYYLVRLTCYQRNTGRGDNGSKIFEKEFLDFRKAKDYADRVKKALVAKNTNEMAHEFVHDGFIERLDGIYEITENLLD